MKNKFTMKACGSGGFVWAERRPQTYRFLKQGWNIDLRLGGG